MSEHVTYIIKRIVCMILIFSIYHLIMFINKRGKQIFEDFDLSVLLFVSITSILGILAFLLFYESPEELSENIKEEKEEKEETQELIPLSEITLSTNEKIKGRFLEKNGYFENIENSSRYYKTFIVKIENVK